MPTKEFSYPKYLGKRIRSARVNLGRSQEELADAVSLPRPAISQIESGKRAVDSMELIAFARALKEPVSFFLEPEAGPMEQEEEPMNVLYRADEISEDDKTVVDDFKQLCKDYSTLEGLLNLVEKGTLPKWNLEVTSKWQAITTGEDAAVKLRGIMALGVGPIDDVGGLLENHGVKVIARPMRRESKAWGFSITSKALGDCIFVNSQCAKRRQNFTLAHELGHVVMDHNHSATIYSDAQSPEKTLDDGKQTLIEARANAFAAAFLAPEVGIKEVLAKVGFVEPSRKKLTPHVVNYLADHYRVSYDSMLWRLVNMRVISKQERENFMKYQDMFAPPQSGQAKRTLPERYQALALEAYRRMRISIGKLAEFLRTDMYEAKEIVQKLGIQQSAA